MFARELPPVSVLATASGQNLSTQILTLIITNYLNLVKAILKSYIGTKSGCSTILVGRRKKMGTRTTLRKIFLSHPASFMGIRASGVTPKSSISKSEPVKKKGYSSAKQKPRRNKLNTLKTPTSLSGPVGTKQIKCT